MTCGKFHGGLGLSMLALSASTQGVPPAAAPPPPSTATAPSSTWSNGFWAALEKLGVVFKSISDLGAGADGGQVWIVDVASGIQHRIVTPASVAWPVFGRDGHTVFALLDGRVVRLSILGGDPVPLGSAMGWRKLLGVDAENNVVGFIAARPRVSPAMLTPTGELRVFPLPESDSERERVSLLLQENRAYADGSELIVKRSTHGGRGYDISLVTKSSNKTLSDCGDDYCGQPSLSPDRRYVVYVRTSPQ